MPFEATRGVIDSGFLTENERTGSGSSRESSAVKIPTFEDVHLGKKWGKRIRKNPFSNPMTNSRARAAARVIATTYLTSDPGKYLSDTGVPNMAAAPLSLLFMKEPLY